MAEKGICEVGEKWNDRRGRCVPVTTPMGVAIIAILMAIGGVLMILSGLVLIGIAAISTLCGLSGELWMGFLGLGFGLGIIEILLGVLYIITAIGLWQKRQWAWMVAVVLSIVSVVVALLGGSWLGIIVPAIVLVYLVLKQEQFR